MPNPETTPKSPPVSFVWWPTNIIRVVQGYATTTLPTYERLWFVRDSRGRLTCWRPE
jgi:hypothetical protein